MNEWQLIETAPHNRPILLAGKWDNFMKPGSWEFGIGQWLVTRFPFIGNGPTHWMPLPEPPIE